MTKYVAHPLAETIAQVGDDLVRSTAVRAVVAAVFEKRDVRPGLPQAMIARPVDGTVQPARLRMDHVRLSIGNQAAPGQV
ncbi:hypothetical protein D3C83_55820 [compost metagenome]